MIDCEAKTNKKYIGLDFDVLNPAYENCHREPTAGGRGDLGQNKTNLIYKHRWTQMNTDAIL